MNARTLCLSILYDCEATGYEIRKQSTEGDYSYFVHVSYGAIYPALAKLEQEGLVSVRVEAQDGKPSKKIYSINETGKREFLDSLLDPIAPDIRKSAFMLVAHFAREIPKDLMIQRIEERIAEHSQELETIQKIGETHDGPADSWIIDYCCTCIQASLHYLRTNKEALIGLTKSDDEQKITPAQPTIAAE